MLSRIGRAAVARSSSSVPQAARAACARGLSTLEDRKKGNEATYIQDQERKRIAEMKAKFEALMAKDNNSEEKAELMEILGTRKLTSRATLFFHARI